MRKVILFVSVAVVLSFAGSVLAEKTQVPAGKEDLVLDAMSKAKTAANKKVLKGPVPFAHQEHVTRGLGCQECHHHQEEGETPQPCHQCHKDKKDKNIPKLSDAFHGGTVKSMPALQSCIGCHRRKAYANSASTKAPYERKPCEACHSIKKKKK